jgi:hypothetical protein
VNWRAWRTGRDCPRDVFSLVKTHDFAAFFSRRPHGSLDEPLYRVTYFCTVNL